MPTQVQYVHTTTKHALLVRLAVDIKLLHLLSNQWKIIELLKICFNMSIRFLEIWKPKVREWNICIYEYKWSKRPFGFQVRIVI